MLRTTIALVGAGVPVLAYAHGQEILVLIGYEILFVVLSLIAFVVWALVERKRTGEKVILFLVLLGTVVVGWFIPLSFQYYVQHQVLVITVSILAPVATTSIAFFVLRHHRKSR